ncbi:MAG: response regulator [Lachnospiraceae bacterium]|nr:response regulator [Lachnospiraceae bacterium]
MKYNIDFEIYGSLVTAVILVYFRLKYVGSTESYRRFFNLAFAILTAQLFDMISAITISIGTKELAPLNLILTTGYFFVAFYTSICFVLYISTYLYEKGAKPGYKTFLDILTIGFAVFMAANAVWGFCFRFNYSTGEYIHGAWYYALYFIPGAILLNSLIMIIVYRRFFSKIQWFSIMSFILIVFVGLFLQGVIFTDVYVTYGVISVSLLLIVFSLETPDYRKLQKTMTELEEARKDAEAAKQEAMSANKVKSDFLANMSHEIRTPINSILGFDEMILRESENENISGYASNIRKSSQSLLSLINDILDFSKIESGKMEINTLEYETAPLLSDLILMSEPRAESKRLLLRYDIDEKLPKKLIGDDVRLRQIITNLLTNAIKYTHEGEICLRVKVESIENNKLRLHVSVKDTGIGIKKEDMDRLFSAFERVEELRNRNIEGTGLGLSITTRLLKLMDSSLMVDSVYGEGSDFHFVIEQGIADPEAIGDFNKAIKISEQTVTVTHESFTAPDAKILVVDDVEMNLQVFCGLLKNTGMQITTADNGFKVPGLLAKNNYDMIFMDHLMPQMDGIETLKRCVDAGLIDTKKLPVIALTANAIIGAKEMYLAEGFSDYLTKPVDSKALESMLLKYLPAEKVKLNEAEDMAKSKPAEIVSLSGSSKHENLIDFNTGIEYAAGDKDFYKDLVASFLAVDYATELDTFLSESNWKEYMVRVHGLKSSAATLGARPLSETAKKQELALKERDDKDYVISHHGELKRLLAETRSLFEKHDFS